MGKAYDPTQLVPEIFLGITNNSTVFEVARSGNACITWFGEPKISENDVRQTLFEKVLVL